MVTAHLRCLHRHSAAPPPAYHLSLIAQYLSDIISNRKDQVNFILY